MIIDRHNYEEYFLLYVDNELNVDQKKQVEAFISANPDLEEEFVMLQQSRLVPDDSIVFEGKEMLMKKESGPITIDNYEQWLILYVDDELTTAEKISVEKFAESHPTVKAELNLFLQTKLEPQQEIVFPYKESLYKTEEKVRVISIRWLRVAAVIAFLLATGFGIYSIVNSGNDKQGGSVVIKTDNSKKPIETKTTEQSIQPKQNQDQAQNQNGATPESQKPLPVEYKIEHQRSPEKQKLAVNNEKNIPQQLQEIEKTPVQTIPNIANSEVVNNGTKTIDAPLADTKNTTTAINTDTGKENNNRFGVTNSNPETPNEYKNGGTPTDEVAKDDNENRKLRGIFRRATRFIERTTKLNPANDDGKVLIGSMAVSVK
jgi:hypothetical protein